MKFEGKLEKSGGKQRGRKVEMEGSEMVGRRRKGRLEGRREMEERRSEGKGNSKNKGKRELGKRRETLARMGKEKREEGSSQVGRKESGKVGNGEKEIKGERKWNIWRSIGREYGGNWRKSGGKKGRKGWKEGGKEREIGGFKGRGNWEKEEKLEKVGKWRRGRRKFTGGKKEE